METETMPRVVAEAKVENIYDLHEVTQGARPEDHVRRVIITDALVDTGATTLSMPGKLIQQLGLEKSYENRATSSQGLTTVNVYGPVRITLMGRFCSVDVVEVPDEVPVLIGQIPLEMLDLVVDPQS